MGQVPTPQEESCTGLTSELPALGLSSSQWPQQTTGDSRRRGGRRSFVAGWQDWWVFVVAFGGGWVRQKSRVSGFKAPPHLLLLPSEEIFRGLVVLRGGDRKRL